MEKHRNKTIVNNSECLLPSSKCDVKVTSDSERISRTSCWIIYSLSMNEKLLNTTECLSRNEGHQRRFSHWWRKKSTIFLQQTCRHDGKCYRICTQPWKSVKDFKGKQYSHVIFITTYSRWSSVLLVNRKWWYSTRCILNASRGLETFE